MATPAPPGYIVRPVPNRSPGRIAGADTLGLVLHVQVGTGPLYGWFSNAAAQASSTWWAGRAGGREQYGDPDHDMFWAQANGNRTYHSIETEGTPDQPLTPEQIETVAVAYAWGHTRYGWPLQLAEKPGQPGLGWHGMGGKAWGNHPYCPGDIRKAQRGAILARARQITTGTNQQEDDMPYTPDDLAAIVQQNVKAALIEAGKRATPADRQAADALRAIVASAASPAALAQSIAANLPATGGQPITDAQLERVLRAVLGSVDGSAQ